LSERLADLEEDGLDIGSVRIYKPTTTSPAKVVVELSDNGPCAEMPKHYSMEFTKCNRKMHLFSEDIAGRAMRIEGRVDREFFMKPSDAKEYSKVMRQRNEEADRPKRSIQVVDQVQGSHRIGLIKPVNEMELIRAQKAKIVPEEKRERLPKKEVTDMLFRAFERMPHWNFKGLVDYTQQPAVLLNCDLHLYFFG